MRIATSVKLVGFGTFLHGGYIRPLPPNLVNTKISQALQADFNALIEHFHLSMA